MRLRTNHPARVTLLAGSGVAVDREGLVRAGGQPGLQAALKVSAQQSDHHLFLHTEIFTTRFISMDGTNVVMAVLLLLDRRQLQPDGHPAASPLPSLPPELQAGAVGHGSLRCGDHLPLGARSYCNKAVLSESIHADDRNAENIAESSNPENPAIKLNINKAKKRNRGDYVLNSNGFKKKVKWYHMPKVQGEILYGLHPVYLALLENKRQFYNIYVKKDNVERQEIKNEILKLAASKDIVVRALEAYFFNVNQIFLGNTRTCRMSPVVSKASSGAMEVMPIYQTNKVKLINKLKSLGWAIVGTATESSQSNTVPIETYSVTKPTLLVLGNEGRGISGNVSDCCDEFVYVQSLCPKSHVESLNVGVAAGILLHHLTSTLPK
ncbi:MRM1 [Cordylochernes scorpioides]|uniref:MRM1 n=1 Tax=Cordylochernes scorpioides TaxID=51811 RepID=A0ABY6KE73_9ARAC|nr:MRM1 [Cordylochernes scorpioides]